MIRFCFALLLVPGIVISQDIIVKISRPYLQFSVAD